MRAKKEWRPVGPEEIHTVTIRRDPVTGVVVTERWVKDGKAHCEHGPALITRDPVTGVMVHESWYTNGLHHRLDGPSCILRKPDGRVYYTEWYRNGEKVPAPNRPRRAAKTGSEQRPLPSAGPTA
jgi:hypothetical protein